MKTKNKFTQIQARRSASARAAVNAAVAQRVSRMQFITSAGGQFTDYDLMQAADSRFFMVTRTKGLPMCIRPMSPLQTARWILSDVVPKQLRSFFKITL